MSSKPNLIYKLFLGICHSHLNSWLANSLNPSKFVALLKKCKQSTQYIKYSVITRIFNSKSIIKIYLTTINCFKLDMVM